MEQKEFKIESRTEEFKVGKITPVEFLGISSQLALIDNYINATEVSKFALEHCLVKMGEKWVPVKTKGSEVYMPLGIEEDIFALNEIFTYFVENVLLKAFTNSRESK